MNKIFITTCLFLVLFTVGVVSRGFEIPREVNETLSLEPAVIQEHIDRYLFFASFWLNDPSNQDEIQHYLLLARNLSRLIHIPSLRESVLAIVDDFFDVAERLKNRLSQTLHNVSVLELNRSVDLSFLRENDRIQTYHLIWPDGFSRQWNLYPPNEEIRYAIEVRKAVHDLYVFTMNELEELGERSLCKLSNLFVSQLRRLSKEDLATIKHIQELLRNSRRYIDMRFFYHLFKLEEGAKIINIIQHALDLTLPGNQRLETTLRRVAANVAQGLDRIDLADVKSFGKSALNYLFNHLETLKGELVNLADRALVSSNQNADYSAINEFYSNYSNTSSNATSRAGQLLAERLQTLREGLGEKLTQFRDTTIRDLGNLVSSYLANATSEYIPNYDDSNFERTLTYSMDIITENLRDLVNNLGYSFNLYDKYESARRRNEYQGYGGYGGSSGSYGGYGGSSGSYGGYGGSYGGYGGSSGSYGGYGGSSTGGYGGSSGSYGGYGGYGYNQSNNSRSSGSYGGYGASSTGGYGGYGGYGYNQSNNSNFSASGTTATPASTSSCSSEQFQCRNGNCIRASYVCDRDNDCGDRSDEDPSYFGLYPSSRYSNRCPQTNSTPSYSDNQTNSSNSSESSSLNNATNDSSSQNDSTSQSTPVTVPVSSCSSEQFQCRNGNCIRASYVCDRDNDCGDRSDEDPSYFGLFPSSSYSNRCPQTQSTPSDSDNQTNSSNSSESGSNATNDSSSQNDSTSQSTPVSVPVSTCSSWQFQCRNGNCIRASYVCDNDNDCGDRSDEDPSYFGLYPSSSYSNRCPQTQSTTSGSENQYNSSNSSESQNYSSSQSDSATSNVFSGIRDIFNNNLSSDSASSKVYQPRKSKGSKKH